MFTFFATLTTRGGMISYEVVYYYYLNGFSIGLK